MRPRFGHDVGSSRRMGRLAATPALASLVAVHVGECLRGRQHNWIDLDEMPGPPSEPGGGMTWETVSDRRQMKPGHRYWCDACDETRTRGDAQQVELTHRAEYLDAEIHLGAARDCRRCEHHRRGKSMKDDEKTRDTIAAGAAVTEANDPNHAPPGDGDVAAAMAAGPLADGDAIKARAAEIREARERGECPGCGKPEGQEHGSECPKVDRGAANDGRSGAPLVGAPPINSAHFSTVLVEKDDTWVRKVEADEYVARTIAAENAIDSMVSLLRTALHVYNVQNAIPIYRSEPRGISPLEVLRGVDGDALAETIIDDVPPSEARHTTRNPPTDDPDSSKK